MNVTQTATATTIDRPTSPTLTCAVCPFARLIEDNRYCCQVSQTAADVVRGHWEATISCYEALAKAGAEKAATPAVAELEAPIAQTETPAPTTPAAIGENDEPPNRGDNGRGRVQPIAAPKKLMLSLVAVKRITSDIPASNFDRFELEIAGS